MKYSMTYGYSGEAANTRVAHNSSETLFTALRASDNAAYWVDITLHAPIAESYIMIPACAYNGNRFKAVARKYPPMYIESEFGADVPVRMTQVPRLAPEGDSFMDVTTGDMSVPCVCVFDKANSTGFMLFFSQGAHDLNYGVSLDQVGDTLRIRLRAPARRRLVYRWYDGIPSLRELPDADPPLSVQPGDATSIDHCIFTFLCDSVTALYREFFRKRLLLYRGAPHASLPFSAFWDMSLAELDRAHFVEPEGFYALNAQDGRETSIYSVWQPGWVGGGMNTLPVICHGDSTSVTRAVRTLEFAARQQSAAGWYYGVYAKGKTYHDCFHHYGDRCSMVLVRKHADLTYFMFKQIAILERTGRAVPETVRASAEKAADALVKLWNENGQLGQFLNGETGSIVVGGSASGAIAPAALCAAYTVTRKHEYAACARELGEHFYAATLAGITTGGPGEILQAPDSESAAALVESFIALYELDGKRWLSCARDAAYQLSSWVVAYDYAFPADSRFGRMGIHAAGSVWANVQNKHSAPGLCTLSAAMLMKLYRATGDTAYMDLMQQIAHYSPQSASHPERPMTTMSGTALRPGEMCERVNLSDWEGTEGVGDSIFGASSWPEVAMMLTWLEVPGIYIDIDSNRIWTSDHVNAYIAGNKLRIENPTVYPARVKLLAETAEHRARTLGLWWQDMLKTVSVAPGDTAEIDISALA